MKIKKQIAIETRNLVQAVFESVQELLGFLCSRVVVTLSKARLVGRRPAGARGSHAKARHNVDMNCCSGGNSMVLA